MEGNVQITWNQFVESSYTKGIARICMVVAIPALLSVGGLILGLMADVAGVKNTIAIRAGDNEQFQATITTDVAEVKEGQAAIADDVVAIRLQVSNMAGILAEMQRRDTAMANAARLSIAP